jgi:hypothetical protein
MSKTFYHDIDSVISSLKGVEIFFREIMKYESEINLWGFSLVRRWDYYHEVDIILQNVDSLIAQLIEVSRILDRDSCESIQSIIEASNFLDSIGRVYVSLKIEIESFSLFSFPIFPSMVDFYSKLLWRRPRRHSFFEVYATPIQELLLTLRRLISQAKSLRSAYINKLQSDDELFRPSNIDRKVVGNYIERAVLIIQSSSLAEKEKKGLLKHLEYTKGELSKTQPSWKKVIGALVIVSTLLGGFADAPEAFDNIGKAIQYILGASVEYQLPRQLPVLPQDRGSASM